MSVQTSRTALQLQQESDNGNSEGRGIHFAVVVQTGWQRPVDSPQNSLNLPVSYFFILSHHLCYIWSLFGLFLLEEYTVTVSAWRLYGMRKGIQTGNHFLCRLNHQLLKSVFGLEPRLCLLQHCWHLIVLGTLQGIIPLFSSYSSPFLVLAFSCLARLVTCPP